MSRLLYRLGVLCVRRKYVVFLVWALIVVAVGAGVALLGMRTTNDIRLPGTGAQQATDMLRAEFPPQQNGLSPLVFHVSSGKLTDPANKKAVEDALRAIEAMPEVHTVISPFSRAGESFVSDDGRTAVAQVLMGLDWGKLDKEMASRVLAAADPARAAGIQVEAGGGIGAKIAESKSRRSEAIGVAAAVVIMAFTFGALVAAGMPIITALVGLIVGLGLVGLLGHVVSIPTVAPTLATMIGLGVGIDYALFIVFRHRDQLHHGMSVEDSVAHAMATSGSAVVFAGGTVIVALLALLVARVPILGAMGYASALVVLVAVLTAITLLPALLALLGRRIDAWPLPGQKAQHAGADRRERVGALGRARDEAPVDRPRRLRGRARAAHGADADAAPGARGHRRVVQVDLAAARLRPDLRRARTRGQRAPARVGGARSGGRAQRRVHAEARRGAAAQGQARARGAPPQEEGGGARERAATG